MNSLGEKRQVGRNICLTDLTNYYSVAVAAVSFGVSLKRRQIYLKKNIVIFCFWHNSHKFYFISLLPSFLFAFIFLDSLQYVLLGKSTKISSRLRYFNNVIFSLGGAISLNFFSTYLVQACAKLFCYSSESAEI